MFKMLPPLFPRSHAVLLSFRAAFSVKNKPPENQSSPETNAPWIVLNTRVLNNRILEAHAKLRKRIDEFLATLQAYGPTDKDHLKDLRMNTGRARGVVYHGHVMGEDGDTYILEWTAVDEKDRIMALIGFDSHESYHFHQKPLSEDQKRAILENPKNCKILDYFKKQRKLSEETSNEICKIRKRCS